MLICLNYLEWRSGKCPWQIIGEWWPDTITDACWHAAYQRHIRADRMCFHDGTQLGFTILHPSEWREAPEERAHRELRTKDWEERKIKKTLRRFELLSKADVDRILMADVCGGVLNSGETLSFFFLKREKKSEEQNCCSSCWKDMGDTFEDVEVLYLSLESKFMSTLSSLKLFLAYTCSKVSVCDSTCLQKYSICSCHLMWRELTPKCILMCKQSKTLILAHFTHGIEYKRKQAPKCFVLQCFRDTFGLIGAVNTNAS